ncbi:MAG: TetR/AcrR family transcriptional regulator [Rhodococcus sp. (in: high G+C Gram-positive bacteria)]|uniref:TetR/AcrR family transcriptional regulator n=1 Tax=Rhodococcus sp. TaxID=1831 RepID=UPI003BB5B7F0
MSRSPGRRTGPKPSFSESDAVQAALSLGIDRFTLGEVAKALGVSTPSLYRVIESREHLTHLCLARAADRMETLSADVDPGHSWQQIVRDYAAVFWQALEEYPGLAGAILGNPGAHAHVQGYLRMLRAALREARFPGPDADIDFVIDFVGDTALVTHLGVSAMRQTDSTGELGITTTRRMVSEQSGPGEEPVLQADDSWVDRGWLDRKVEFIVAAVEAGIGVTGAV